MFITEEKMGIEMFASVFSAIPVELSDRVSTTLIAALFVAGLAGMLYVVVEKFLRYRRSRRSFRRHAILSVIPLLLFACFSALGIACLTTSVRSFSPAPEVIDEFVGADSASASAETSNSAYLTQVAYTLPGERSQSRAYAPNTTPESRAYAPTTASVSRAYAPDATPQSQKTAGPQATFVSPNADVASAQQASSLPEEVAPEPLTSIQTVEEKFIPSMSAVSHAYAPVSDSTLSSTSKPSVKSYVSGGAGDRIVAEFTPTRPALPLCFAERDDFNPISPTSFVERDSSLSTNHVGLSDLTNSELEHGDSMLHRLDEERANLNREVLAAVLTINIKKSEIDNVHGSGFAVQYDDRVFVITNCHVVERANKVSEVKISTYNGQVFTPIRIYPCAEFDIAALELDPRTVSELSDLRLCRLRSSSKLHVGFEVFTIGAPLFMDWTLTCCHVGRLYSNVAELKHAGIIENHSENKNKDIIRYIQISGVILEGNSGGPLFDAQGNVVGVVTATLMQQSDHNKSYATGIAFALPIEDALSIVRNMVETGTWSRSFLGIVLDGSRSPEYVLRNGVGLTEVRPSSPAELAGMKVGDHVLTFNGEKVRSKFDLARMIALSKPGEEGSLEVIRNGQPISLTFVPCANTQPAPQKINPRAPATTIRR